MFKYLFTSSYPVLLICTGASAVALGNRVFFIGYVRLQTKQYNAQSNEHTAGTYVLYIHTYSGSVRTAFKSHLHIYIHTHVCAWVVKYCMQLMTDVLSTWGPWRALQRATSCLWFCCLFMRTIQLAWWSTLTNVCCCHPGESMALRVAVCAFDITVLNTYFNWSQRWQDGL